MSRSSTIGKKGLKRGTDELKDNRISEKRANTI
jgi:hypothetical protein